MPVVCLHAYTVELRLPKGVSHVFDIDGDRLVRDVGSVIAEKLPSEIVTTEENTAFVFGDCSMPYAEFFKGLTNDEATLGELGDFAIQIDDVPPGSVEVTVVEQGGGTRTVTVPTPGKVGALQAALGQAYDGDMSTMTLMMEGKFKVVVNVVENKDEEMLSLLSRGLANLPPMMRPAADPTFETLSVHLAPGARTKPTTAGGGGGGGEGGDDATGAGGGESGGEDGRVPIFSQTNEFAQECTTKTRAAIREAQSTNEVDTVPTPLEPAHWLRVLAPSPDSDSYLSFAAPNESVEKVRGRHTPLHHPPAHTHWLPSRRG